MATITTKYSVGDVVYHATTATERRRHPCPDCKGEGKWKALSPAGGEYTFSCPRCAASYLSDRDLSLEYTAYAPRANRLTIGSIQVNTAHNAYDSGNRYMCVETGVGSGSVYNEADLFDTEEEALTVARARADQQNQTTDWVVKLYNKSLSISDYQIEHAALKLASDAKSRASSMLWNIGDLFEKIEEADGKEDILQAIQDYKDFDWERDKRTAEQERA